ncbi:MAG: Do family serine endopeptidase [Rhizobiales bacterium TMED83]|jgi:Do/DeqQ family serine protease|nr:serine protease [Rhodobiaceae bacterium]RPF92940.1 MAG: Do family serine endopeptidase [Rhizobiales bacterium TMED83]HCD16263.1 serine protease [Rhodobiaceae bacterium]
MCIFLRIEKRHAAFVVCLFAFAPLFAMMSAYEVRAQDARLVPENAAQIQLSFAPVVAKVVPSVVNVYARRVVQRRRGLFDDPFFQQFFGDDFVAPRQRTQQSLGSGVIVDAGGLIVTNHHVIDGAQELTVVLSDRREFKADLVLDDARTDLAVLKLQDPPASLPALGLRDSDDIRVGDLVLAVGNPFGVGQTVTNGIVSALARSQVGVADYQSFIQTDAAINPGNSGGALVTLDGRLLGVNTAIFSKSGGSVGIGFAIPANMVARVVQAAQTDSEVKRPWLGASFQDVGADIADAFGLARAGGAVIVDLHEASPLAQAGLRKGDVIQTVNGRDVFSPADVRFRIGTLEIGGQVELGAYRRSAQIVVDVALVSAPEVPLRNIQRVGGQGPLAGLQIANINPALSEERGLPAGKKGVIVLDVGANSPARRAGFRIGDIVLQINANPVERVQDVLRLAPNTPGETALEIERGSRRLRVTLRR